MKVIELKSKFPSNTKFALYQDGKPIINAMKDDKVSDWIVTADFTVIVHIK